MVAAQMVAVQEAVVQVKRAAAAEVKMVVVAAQEAVIVNKPFENL